MNELHSNLVYVRSLLSAIEKELQSGRAKSINLAIVHYEAGMNR